MMRQMRENTKWIMLITALAFFALMVFEWGMDASGRSGVGQGSVGRVNGTPVSYDQWQTIRRNLFDQVQAASDEPLTSAQNSEIDDAAWEEAVNQILIQEELQRRGIRVSDEEIRQAARFYPPPSLRESTVFQTDGQFDLQKYQQYLAAVDELTLLQLEAYYRDLIPREKLLRQVTEGIYATDGQLWQAYKDQNERVSARFIALGPATMIPDSAATPTPAEISRYYRENREDFRIPARASVRYVSLSKAPLAVDTAAAEQRARDIRQEILDGGDFAEIALRESADQGSAELGGDLGTFGRGAMVPAFDSVAFGAPVGRLTEPVRTQFGWHLIEVTERSADSVSARHILVPVELTDQTELALFTVADSLEALLEDRSLEEAGTMLDLQVQTADLTQEFPFVAGPGQIAEGADWAIEEAAPGDASPVFENDAAFYALELVSFTPEGYLSEEQARVSIQQILMQERKLQMAVARAQEAIASLPAGASLEQIAEALGTQVQTSQPFTRNDFVPGMGRQNAAIGAAFGLPEGGRSGLVTTAQDAFILEVVERMPADSAAWLEQKEQQRLLTMNQIGQRRFTDWLEGLRQNARIVDQRDEVLRQTEEQVPLGGVFGVGR